MTTDEGTFEQTYPALSRWAQGCGWLEIGHVDWSASLIRVLDEGGLVWEGGAVSSNLSEALAVAEAAITTWFQGYDRARTSDGIDQEGAE